MTSELPAENTSGTAQDATKWTNNRKAKIGVPIAVASLVAAGIVGINIAGSGSDQATAASTEPAAAAAAAGHREAREAKAVLLTADGTAIGTVKFRRKSQRTLVEANVMLPTGLSAMEAFHGFHIHANDKPENGAGCLADPAQPPATWFVSADGHLTETGKKHSEHTGDMPSLLVNDDGSATLKFTSTRLSIDDLSNRAVMLHAGADNFGNIPTGSGADQYTANSPAATDKTAATGNAGDRIACGLISIVR